MTASKHLHAMLFVLLAAFVLTSAASQAMPAAASSLSVSVRPLYHASANVPICDPTVTVTPIPLIGVITAVNVTNIDAACSGWTLKVQITNASNVPVGQELTVVVNDTSELLAVPSLNPGLGFHVYHTFQRLP